MCLLSPDPNLSKPWCYFIPADQSFHDADGYCPAIAVMDDDGYYPLSGDPEKLQAPWIWGKTREEATIICQQENDRLNLTGMEVARIITSSIRASNI